MFTIEQIKEAHSKVKSGADFPNYIQNLIILGVKGYDTYVNDGKVQYFGVNNYSVASDEKYDEIKIGTSAVFFYFSKWPSLFYFNFIYLFLPM